MKITFTREELAEMARVDAEIELAPLTQREIDECEMRDLMIILQEKGRPAYCEAKRKRKYRSMNRQRISNYNKAYYEENKPRIAERRRRLREAKKAKAQEA